MKPLVILITACVALGISIYALSRRHSSESSTLAITPLQPTAPKTGATPLEAKRKERAEKRIQAQRLSKHKRAFYNGTLNQQTASELGISDVKRLAINREVTDLRTAIDDLQARHLTIQPTESGETFDLPNLEKPMETLRMEFDRKVATLVSDELASLLGKLLQQTDKGFPDGKPRHFAWDLDDTRLLLTEAPSAAAEPTKMLQCKYSEIPSEPVARATELNSLKANLSRWPAFIDKVKVFDAVVQRLDESP